jgi:hypothetical protein
MGRRIIQVEVESDEEELLVRRALDFEREMRELALTEPAARVFDACETAVVAERDRIAAGMLERALAARAEQVEKKRPGPTLPLLRQGPGEPRPIDPDDPDPDRPRPNRSATVPVPLRRRPCRLPRRLGPA